MIIGIGSDLIDITRIAKVIERHGERFLDRIFTDAERAKAARRARSERVGVETPSQVRAVGCGGAGVAVGLAGAKAQAPGAIATTHGQQP